MRYNSGRNDRDTQWPNGAFVCLFPLYFIVLVRFRVRLLSLDSLLSLASV